jgi:ParB family chromosome partitioning protein
MVRVEAIRANPMQPRTRIRDKDLAALADSIRDQGVLEPLVVRRDGLDEYELIAGERRLRASRLAGLTHVPVILKDADPLQMLEMALIENLHREDLNPMDEAAGYVRLAEEFSRTQEELARLSGRDRSTVANLIRLLSLPAPIQEDVRQGRLTAGHGRALLALGEESRMLAAREDVLTRGFSVRETEQWVKRLLTPKRISRNAAADAAYYEALAESMARSLGAKVRVVAKGRRKRVEIAFSSSEELERLLNRLGVRPV